MLELTWQQRLLLRIFGKVKVDEKDYPKGKAIIYAFTCPEHGLKTSIKRGYCEDLICDECEEVRLSGK
jgi:hypothetical protein